MRSLRSLCPWILASFGVVSLAVVSADRVAGEEWTMLRGTTFNAELVGIWNGRAVLRRGDGRQASVRLEDLNATSRIKAQDLYEEIESSMKGRVSEMDKVAVEAAAPAPATLKEPTDAPKYQPPAEGLDLQSTLDQMQAQATAGHLRVYFDVLPASQKVAADECFKLALRKLDPAQYELCRSTFYRLANLVVTKQRWLFSHPTFATIGDGNKESLVSLSMAMQKWGNEQNASLDALQKASLEESLAKFDESTSPYLFEFLRQNSLIATMVFAPYQVEALPTGGMVAKQTLPLLGNSTSRSMIALENRWAEGTTPEDAKAKWDGYKKSLEAIPDGSIRLRPETAAVVTGLSAQLGSLEAAISRGTFHRALDDLLAQLTPSIGQWAGVRQNPGMYGSEMSMDSYDSSMQSEGSMSGQDEAARAAAAAAAASGPPGR